MDTHIQQIISTYRRSKIQSEAEVCSKLIVPLLETLGYAPEYRSQEFPVYGYAGGKKLAPKNADFILFDSTDFADYRERTQNNVKWVQNHSLLVVEAKKPGMMPKDLGQAQFYTMWTKALAYIETDGEVILGYYYNPVAEDYETLKTRIDVLDEQSSIQSFSFEKLSELKKKGIKIFDTIGREELTHTICYEGLNETDFYLPPEVAVLYRRLLGKNANNRNDLEVMSQFLNMTDNFLQYDVRYDIPPYMMDIPRHFYEGKLCVDNSIFPITSGQVVEYYWNNIEKYEFDSQYIQAVIKYKDGKLVAFDVGFQVLDSKVTARINSFRLVQKCLQARTLQLTVNKDPELNIVLPAGDPGGLWESKEYMLETYEFWLSVQQKLKVIEEYYNIEFHLRYLEKSEEIEKMLNSVYAVYYGICLQKNCEISLPGDFFEEDLVVKEPTLFQEDTLIPLPIETIYGIDFQAFRSSILPCNAVFAGKTESDIIILPGCCEYQIAEAAG